MITVVCLELWNTSMVLQIQTGSVTYMYARNESALYLVYIDTS